MQNEGSLPTPAYQMELALGAVQLTATCTHLVSYTGSSLPSPPSLFSAVPLVLSSGKAALRHFTGTLQGSHLLAGLLSWLLDIALLANAKAQITELAGSVPPRLLMEWLGQVVRGLQFLHSSHQTAGKCR